MHEDATGRPTDTTVLRRVRVDLIQGRLTVEGADVSEARIEAHYADDRPEGDPDARDPIADGMLRVTRVSDELRVHTPRGGWLDTFRGRGREVAVDVRLIIPRDASLGVDVVQAAVRTTGCHGGQVLRGVTGSVEVLDAAGSLDVRTVSGDVRIAGTTLAPRVATTSGSVAVTSETLQGLRATTVNGDLTITGSLSVDGEHSVESISGDLRLVSSDVALEVRTTSGHARSGTGVRRVADHGRIRLVAGDGSASMRFRSVSGDASLDGSVHAAGATASERASDEPHLDDPFPSDPLLASLEALARGEITVDEADLELGARYDRP